MNFGAARYLGSEKSSQLTFRKGETRGTVCASWGISENHRLGGLSMIAFVIDPSRVFLRSPSSAVSTHW